MVDPKLISVMLKLALDTNAVKPEEVWAILQKKRMGGEEDKNTETVDSEILDADETSNDETRNDEGQILENTFRELEIEDAIEEAQDNKKYNINAGTQDTLFSTSSANNTSVQKTASVWQNLRDKFAKPKISVKFKS